LLFYHFEICKLIINIDNPPADCVSTPLCTRGALGFGGALPQTPLRGSSPFAQGGLVFWWGTPTDSATRIPPFAQGGLFSVGTLPQTPLRGSIPLCTKGSFSWMQIAFSQHKGAGVMQYPVWSLFIYIQTKLPADRPGVFLLFIFLQRRCPVQLLQQLRLLPRLLSYPMRKE